MLIRAPPDPAAPAMPESARSWLTDAMWAQLKMLESLPVFKSVSGREVLSSLVRHGIR